MVGRPIVEAHILRSLPVHERVSVVSCVCVYVSWFIVYVARFINSRLVTQKRAAPADWCLSVMRCTSAYRLVLEYAAFWLFPRHIPQSLVCQHSHASCTTLLHPIAHVHIEQYDIVDACRHRMRNRHTHIFNRYYVCFVPMDVQCVFYCYYFLPVQFAICCGIQRHYERCKRHEQYNGNHIACLFLSFFFFIYFSFLRSVLSLVCSNVFLVGYLYNNKNRIYILVWRCDWREQMLNHMERRWWYRWTVWVCAKLHMQTR